MFHWPGEHETFRECQLANKCKEFTFSKHNRIEKLQFSSAHQVFGKDDQPQMKDVKQGRLGDCWFCVSMMSVAHKEPDSIKAMIQPKVVSPNNIYAVTLNQLGVPRTVIVDTVIPFADDIPAFNRVNPHTNAIWPLLIQKAYAKMTGNYFHIDSGRGVDGIKELIGSANFNLYYNKSGQAPDSEKISKLF